MLLFIVGCEGVVPSGRQSANGSLLDVRLLETAILYTPLTTKAGLTTEERDLVAAAYDAGTLLVCVATCSLAAGINL